MKDSFSSAENLTGAQIEAEPEASFDATHCFFSVTNKLMEN